jgi:hypothetical protein
LEVFVKRSHHAVYIVAGAILVFSPDTMESVRENILDSTLFLQLAANRKFPEISDFTQWHKAYLFHSHSLEWTHLSAWSQFSSGADSIDFRLDELIGTQLSSRLSREQVEQIDLALSCITTMPMAAMAARVLREHAVECAASEDANVPVENVEGRAAPCLTRLRVQVGYVDGAGRLTCVWVYVQSAEAIQNDFLVQALMAKQVFGNIQVNGVVAELDDFDYESTRKRIIAAVGSLRQGKIVKIDD